LNEAALKTGVSLSGRTGWSEAKGRVGVISRLDERRF